MAIRLWRNFPDALRFSSKINAEHHHKRTLNKFCKQMEIYGQTNLPLLLNRYPEYNKELAGDWITTLRGRLLFNILFSKLLRLINIILPNIKIIRYLVIYSVICGAREANYSRWLFVTVFKLVSSIIIYFFNSNVEIYINLLKFG